MNNANAGAPLRLRPRLSALVAAVLGKRPFLQDMTLACGSPLNVLFPEQLAENLASFRRVLSDHGLSGRIFFAHKSNQSHSLIRQLATEPVCADVASLEELRHALGAGFTGDRLEATGPKSPEFIALCLQHAVVLNVDSLAELRDIEKVSRALRLKERARLLLRFSGFFAAHTPVLQKQSRFGIAFDARREALEFVAKSRHLTLLGYSFHLDTVTVEERVVAVENCLSAFEEALTMGLEPRVLDIGGGFKISYLENEGEWLAYVSALKRAALGAGQQLTWQNNFFGLAADQGVLRGKLNTYSYFEPRPGALFLDDILNAQLPSLGGRPVGEVLRDNMIELWIEPGRALLDQCGVTVARVNSVKVSASGDTLVGLNMKRQDLSFLDQEVFVDPVVISRKSAAEKNVDGGTVPGADTVAAPGADSVAASGASVFFTGNLCLEGDLIFRHRVSLPFLPEPGDLVAFINTAAYMMDFSATNSIMQPPARRVAVVRERRRFHWMLDEQYTPIWRLTR